jgi:hypothetical protein
MKAGFMKFVFSLISLFFLVGCGAAGEIEVEAELMPTFVVPAETQMPVSATALPPVVAGETEDASLTELAVILVGRGELLNLRTGAGIENEVIGGLASNERRITRTGLTAVSAEERWHEVRTPTGQVGWVNARFLTEYVAPEIFCADPQVAVLLENFFLALQTENGESLAGLISPVHGLDLRYFHYGTLANYTPEEALWVFESSYEMLWGNAAGSGLVVQGTFREIPLPRLLEVFGAEHQLLCNDIGQLNAFAQTPWLPEYENINFYQVYKPGTEQYGGLDWLAWLVGVEYVNGKPYLFSLTGFEWTP